MSDRSAFRSTLTAILNGIGGALHRFGLAEEEYAKDVQKKTGDSVMVGLWCAHKAAADCSRRLAVDSEQQCPQCAGQGKWQEQVGEVSRDMASDAGEPAMVGQPVYREVICEFCGGGGVVGAPLAPPESFAVQVFKDGSAWCALRGDDLMSGSAGFGESPDAALAALAGHPFPAETRAMEGAKP